MNSTASRVARRRGATAIAANQATKITFIGRRDVVPTTAGADGVADQPEGRSPGDRVAVGIELDRCHPVGEVRYREDPGRVWQADSVRRGESSSAEVALANPIACRR